MLAALRILIELDWPMRALGPLIGRYHPFRADFARDPYPQYHALRAEAPVYWSRALRSFVLTRHADVDVALSDPRFSTDRNEHALLRLVSRLVPLRPEVREGLRVNLASAAPVDHRRQRGLVKDFFSAASVEGLRPRIREIVDEQLAAAARGGGLEFVRDFAVPVPLFVIMEILGLPRGDAERLKAWSSAFSVLLDPLVPGGSLRRVQRAFLELCAHLRGRLDEKRAAPENDLLTRLAAAQDEGSVSEIELMTLCAFVLSAGHETVTDLLANAVVALLRDPGERKRLQDDPSLMRSAVEELLRFESPVQAVTRIGVADCELSGVRIRPGRLVTAVIGAANRDPERFPQPDRLDLDRRDNPHLAFGAGAHFCPGAALARIEAQVALAALLERFPDFSGDPDAVRWKPSLGLRGVFALPLSL